MEEVISRLSHGLRDVRIFIDLSCSVVEASTEIDESIDILSIRLSSLVVPLQSFLEILIFYD